MSEIVTLAGDIGRVCVRGGHGGRRRGGHAGRHNRGLAMVQAAGRGWGVGIVPFTFPAAVTSCSVRRGVFYLPIVASFGKAKTLRIYCVCISSAIRQFGNVSTKGKILPLRIK